MAQIAYFSLFLALLCVIYTVITAIFGLQKQPGRWLQSSSKGLQAIAGLFTLAILILLYFLLQRNFHIEYVASYTNLELPILYVISALWAGQEGSFLFWGWVLALCYLVFMKQYKPKDPFESAYLNLVAALTLGFFLIVLLFAANPFKQRAFTPPDGNGLNPLLQNFYMAIHPPILFIGYAGFAIPFALAFSALCLGKLSDEWVKYVRGWTLFSWYFLGIGILLGAHWAYLELGWGGYWAWDPVENSSFIPWLTGTALLHTLMLQKRRSMLTMWNIFASILTFALCILATLITRSGVIDSVHAFGKSTVGVYFLAFLIVCFLCLAGLVTYRWKELRSQNILTALFSKEGSLVLANQLFIGFGFAILYGTLYPFFSELMTGKKVVLSASFFNTVSVPVGLMLLGLIGLCQLLAWDKVSARPALKKLLLPLSITLVGMILMLVFGVRHPVVLLVCGFGSFIVLTRGTELGKTVRTRRKTLQKSYGQVFITTIIAQKRRYAGSLVHVGIALICMGIATSSAYQLKQDVELRPKESVTLGDIRFQYDQLTIHEDARKSSVAAEISVYHHERKLATVIPEKWFYEQAQSQDPQMTTEIGLYTSLTRDIYVILTGWKDDQTAMFTLIMNPLILWIWIGGFVVFTLGIVVAILPRSWGRMPDPKTIAPEE